MTQLLSTSQLRSRNFVGPEVTFKQGLSLFYLNKITIVLNQNFSLSDPRAFYLLTKYQEISSVALNFKLLKNEVLRKLEILEDSEHQIFTVLGVPLVI